MAIRFFIFILGLFLMSCESFDKRLGKSDYYLGATSGPEYTTLYYKFPKDNSGMVGVIESRVTTVYWNEKYILATQCNVWNDSIIGYYIIEKLPYANIGVPWEISGPLSRNEYEKEIENLKLNEKKMQYINLLN